MNRDVAEKDTSRKGKSLKEVHKKGKKKNFSVG